MKKCSLIALICFIPVLSIWAERPVFELSPLAGYNIGGGTSFQQGQVDIADSFAYGLIISTVELQGGISLDLSYTRADSTLDFDADADYPDYSDDAFKMATNYFLFGVNKYFGKQRFRFFIGADIGAAWFDSKVSHVDDAWFFALDVKGGIKFYISDRFGFRLQGRFLMPMVFSEAGLWFGIGSGGSSSGVSLGGNGVIYQGDFLLGLIIRL